MKLSSKTRYATMAMMHLALYNKHAEVVSLSDISHALDLSPSYLEQLFSSLRGADLICGVRGPGGGYRLARRSDKISIAEIVAAVDGDFLYGACVDRGTGQQPTAQSLWEELSIRMEGFLQGVMLADLTGQPKSQVTVVHQNIMAGHIHTMFPTRLSLSAQFI